MDINKLHYTLRFQWSEHDQAFIATVPELPGCKTHGETREEALKNIREAIEVWIEDAQAHGEAIPPPRTASDVSELA